MSPPHLLLAIVNYGPSLTSHKQSVTPASVVPIYLAAIYLVFDARIIISLHRWGAIPLPFGIWKVPKPMSWYAAHSSRAVEITILSDWGFANAKR